MSQKEKKANYNTDDITLEVTNESGNKVKKKKKDQQSYACYE